MSTDWLARVPGLSEALDEILREAFAAVAPLRVPEGAALFRDGSRARGYVLVLEGVVRVQKVGAEGHEIVLYRVEDGQSCVLTTACLLGGQAYPAEGIAETEVELVLLPPELFERAMETSPGFRRHVMRSLGARIGELMMLIEEVAFGQMDRRLARRLLELADAHGEIARTHQALAAELGTAREVISRLLKDFERRGWLALARGRITIRSPDALAELAESSHR